jgi:DNA (cytosine-5)-methyltransferase 1
LLKELGNLGYCLAWRVLDAQFFGIPQRRRRVFLVGYLGADASRPAEVLFERESLLGDTAPVRQSRQDATGTNDTSAQIADTYTLKVRQGTGNGGKGALVHKDMLSTLNASYKPVLFCRAGNHAKAGCHKDIAPTLSAHAAKEPPLISLMPPRHLTPLECERLQGFPDGWTAVTGPDGKPLSDTRRYKMLGNSMAVPVMRWTGSRILRSDI